MKVIPAIDLLGGRVVRLEEGKKENATVYSASAEAVAKEFVAQGTEWLHVVDLDAALGIGSNAQAIKQISESSGAKIQLGGGVRSLEAAEKSFSYGVQRVVVGTAAIDEKRLEEMVSRFGTKIWVACDVQNNKVVVRGWKKNSRLSAAEMISNAEKVGVGGIVVTDVSRDGLVKGISRDFFAEMRRKTQLPLFAAGGISSPADLKQLASLGYDGAIVGKAVYEKRFSLEEGMEAVEDAG